MVAFTKARIREIERDEYARETLEAAMYAEGATLLKCQTYNDAVSLRSRLVNYAKAIQILYVEMGKPGESPFDNLTISINQATIAISKGKPVETLVVPKKAE